MRRLTRLLLPLLLLLLATGASLRPGHTKPPAGSGTGSSAARSVAIGIHPGSPDVNVFLANFATVATAYRAAGGQGCLYFYRSVAELSDASIPGIMAMLGHPACIEVSIWTQSSINTAGNPAECTADWTTDDCRQAIVSAIDQFAKTYLRPGDKLFWGNEHDDYFATHTREIPYHLQLGTEIVAAVSGRGIVSGPVFSYSESSESTIRALWSNRFPVMALNAYSVNLSDGTVGAPGDGITALSTALAFCRTLTSSCGFNETGWPTSATAGGSDAEQLTWATALRAWVIANPVLWLNVFIGMDGDLTSCTDDTCKCWQAAQRLGNAVLRNWLCSMGFYDKDGAIKNSGAALGALLDTVIAGGGSPATTVTAAFAAEKMQGSTCVVPCTVHFDAIGDGTTETVDTDYPRPFHTHAFDWNFGDSGAGNWSVGATTTARNVAMGPITGHTYYTAGTYTVTLTVRAPDGDTDTATASVVVADPDTTFPTTATVCIANGTTPVAGSGGCPAGADVLDSAGDFDAALANAKCAANTQKHRCLFKRGDTFTASTGTALFDSASPGLIAAYGSGADPVVNGPAGTILTYGTGWTVTGLEFHPGAQGGNDYINLSAGKDHESFIDNSILNRDWHGVSTASATAVHNQYIAVVDNRLVNSTGSAGGIFLRGEHMVVMGNEDDQNKTGTTAYNFRTIHFANSVLAHNWFHGPGLNDNSIQIRSWGGTSPPANGPNQFIVVSENLLDATNPSSAGFIKLCQTNTCANDVTTASELTDVLIERNFMRYEAGGSPNVQYGIASGQGGRVTIRNNVLDLQGADLSASGSTSRLFMAHLTNSTLGAGAALIDDDWMAYNNTAYFNSTGPRTLVACDSGSIGTGHACVGNLLDARSESGPHNPTTGSGFTISTANNILSPGSSPFLSAPGAQGTTTAASFDISNTGAAYQAGFAFTGQTLLWDPDDFAGTNQSAPWSAGAFAY